MALGRVGGGHPVTGERRQLQLFLHLIVASCMGVVLPDEPHHQPHFLNETIMTEIEFHTPVLVALGPGRTVRAVSSAAEAVACLSNIYWPKVGKQHWREASHVCMQAWHGYRTAENARLAFIAAADAAGILIVGYRDPASLLAAEG